ncbi:MAG: transposase [Candidatus Hydrogenedentes bacterium]|nr:transposase [Candidatus Hydrogenedentota bacterium]
MQEADRGETTIGDLTRRYEVSEATFYRWRRVYGDMKMPEVKRPRDLEQQNARLKRIVAERGLEIDVIKEVLAKKA